MSLPGTPPFLALICYEILFSGDLGDTAEAGFLLNITNDAWFDNSIGPAQHAHHARVRAVEEGMSLIRAANSGLTFATDPLGRITAQLPPMEMAVLDVASRRAAGADDFRPIPLLAASGGARSRRCDFAAGIARRAGSGAEGAGQIVLPPRRRHIKKSLYPP